MEYQKRRKLMEQVGAVCRALVSAEREEDKEMFVEELGKLARRLKRVKKEKGGENGRN